MARLLLVLLALATASVSTASDASGDAASDASRDDASDASGDAASDASGDAASDASGDAASDASRDDASDASGDAALGAVREALDAASAVANGEGTREEKLASLRQVARALLDTRAMGRRAMEGTLGTQPADRQREYLELFDHVVVRSYLSKLLLFDEPHFAYDEPRVRASGGVLVRTRIVTARDEYFVDYEMSQRDGHWVAIDVIVEGVSLSDNYRAQFTSLLRGRSFEELLDLMRRKTQRLREGAA